MFHTPDRVTVISDIAGYIDFLVPLDIIIYVLASEQLFHLAHLLTCNCNMRVLTKLGSYLGPKILKFEYVLLLSTLSSSLLEYKVLDSVMLQVHALQLRFLMSCPLFQDA
jgi:hypothetical protein